MFALLVCCPRRIGTLYFTKVTVVLEKMILNLKLEVLELSPEDLMS